MEKQKPISVFVIGGGIHPPLNYDIDIFVKGHINKVVKHDSEQAKKALSIAASNLKIIDTEELNKLSEYLNKIYEITPKSLPDLEQVTINDIRPYKPGVKPWENPTQKKTRNRLNKIQLKRLKK